VDRFARNADRSRVANDGAATARSDQRADHPAILAGGRANGARPVPPIVASPAGATSMTTSLARRNPQFVRVQRTRLNLWSATLPQPTAATDVCELRAAFGPTTAHNVSSSATRHSVHSVGGHSLTFGAMTTPSSEQLSDVATELAAAVHGYRRDDNLGTLLDRLRRLAERARPEELVDAAEPYRDLPEVVIPVYEHVVSARPTDARPMVVLANAYWLTGRGPEVVGELASRAVALDPTNRAAWHLWALAESRVRDRVARWQQVAEHFPTDQLARAALADNAASLAGAEHDPLALDLAIATYEGLRAEATEPAQRSALEKAIETLRGWRI
jgi:hypothetical protein